MSLDYEGWTKAFKLNVKAKQKELKRLTDDELIKLHNSLLDSLSEGHGDAVLSLAIYEEIDRRTKAACRFWRRWRRPDECKNRLDHRKRTEEKARLFMEKVLQRELGGAHEKGG